MHIARKRETHRIGRWNCHDCRSSFNVLSGTVFEKTKVPLQKWFLATALVLNAKKSLSSYQLARDLKLNQKTAWYLAMQIRHAMADEQYSRFLAGIVEADETYVGGRPRKGNAGSSGKAKRGRGTDKIPVLGVVERDGYVIAEPSVNVQADTITEFLNMNISPTSTLITDRYASYGFMRYHVKEHLTVDHSIQYVDGIKHTNTIEGFWSLLKRAWFGTHHHYTRQWAIAYVVEACFKYNMRRVTDPYGVFLKAAVKVQA